MSRVKTSLTYFCLQNMDQVILVDEHDQEIGTMEKLEAHRKGVLHRAFSVVLFNDNGEMLLQRRASHKYHSGGLWTNTCCSHPQPSESVVEGARRRLKEELGIVNDELTVVDHILYKVEFENGLTEHEYDYVLTGKWNDDPDLNLQEADAFRWITLTALSEEVSKEPEKFTYWFRYLITHQLLK